MSSISILRSESRGSAEHGWLRSRHTFSFGQYHDPQYMGFRSLRVINQDVVAPSGGFATHPHRDMEIFSYVLSGELAHRDSLGNERTLRPGEVQLMSAGSGVTHSEYNPSGEEPLHFLQIWIQPREKGLPPSYTEWKPQETGSTKGEKVLLISPEGSDGSALIQQEAWVYRVKAQEGATVEHTLPADRGLWFQCIKGLIEVAGERIGAGDAFFSEEGGEYSLEVLEDCEALLFELA